MQPSQRKVCMFMAAGFCASVLIGVLVWGMSFPGRSDAATEAGYVTPTTGVHTAPASPAAHTGEESAPVSVNASAEGLATRGSYALANDPLAPAHVYAPEQANTKTQPATVPTRHYRPSNVVPTSSTPQPTPAPQSSPALPPREAPTRRTTEETTSNESSSTTPLASTTTPPHSPQPTVQEPTPQDPTEATPTTSQQHPHQGLTPTPQPSAQPSATQQPQQPQTETTTTAESTPELTSTAEHVSEETIQPSSR